MCCVLKYQEDFLHYHFIYNVDSTSNIDIDSVSTSSSFRETSVPSKASHLDKNYFVNVSCFEYINT